LTLTWVLPEVLPSLLLLVVAFTDILVVVPSLVFDWAVWPGAELAGEILEVSPLAVKTGAAESGAGEFEA
jgi:hypothetical protein